MDISALIAQRYRSAADLIDKEHMIAIIVCAGGLVDIRPHGKYIEDVSRMVDFIEHATEIAGVDHIGIGSDLGGTSAVSRGFGKEANFRAIAMEMLKRGRGEDTADKVMGGNLFRVW